MNFALRKRSNIQFEPALPFRAVRHAALQTPRTPQPAVESVGLSEQIVPISVAYALD